MKCPECSTEISDRDAKCPKCGFDALLMDEQLLSCPLPQGVVNDFAKVLSPEEAERLATLLQDYKKRSQHDVVVVTQPTTAPLTPGQYVFWLYNEWGVGGTEHRGVMILLALNERRIESEVGFGLEGILNDYRTGEILDSAVVPHLKERRYAEGLYAGAKAIIDALEAP